MLPENLLTLGSPACAGGCLQALGSESATAGVPTRRSRIARRTLVCLMGTQRLLRASRSTEGLTEWNTLRLHPNPRT